MVWLELAPLPGPVDTVAAPPEKPREPPPLIFSEDDVARLCAAAATEAATAAAARLRAREMEERHAVEARLAAAFAALADSIRSRRSALEATAVAVGAALGRSLAWEALQRNPAAVAAGVLSEVLPELREEPEVVVEVAAASAESARARVTALAAESGFSGLLEVRPSTTLRTGEVRVTWRDGWAERLLGDLEARAAAALASLTGVGPPGASFSETVELVGASA